MYKPTRKPCAEGEWVRGKVHPSDSVRGCQKVLEEAPGRAYDVFEPHMQG